MNGNIEQSWEKVNLPYEDGMNFVFLRAIRNGDSERSPFENKIGFEWQMRKDRILTSTGSNLPHLPGTKHDPEKHQETANRKKWLMFIGGN